MFVYLSPFSKVLLALWTFSCINLAESLSRYPPNSSATSVSLRILPLGDSITWGFLSSDGNGYRQDLLKMLNGTQVQYIGSQRSGNMSDNFNEGHPGAIISQIAGYANQSLPQRPNLILLMAGTNDMIKDIDPANAPQRLGSLLDECLATYPHATLVVAQLTPTTNVTATAFMNDFNPTIPILAASRAAAGRKVLSIDMRKYVNTTELNDGLHPTDFGYNQMAIAWHDAIQQALSMGMITPPVYVNRISSRRDRFNSRALKWG